MIGRDAKALVLWVGLPVGGLILALVLIALCWPDFAEVLRLYQSGIGAIIGFLGIMLAVIATAQIGRQHLRHEAMTEALGSAWLVWGELVIVENEMEVSGKFSTVEESELDLPALKKATENLVTGLKIREELILGRLIDGLGRLGYVGVSSLVKVHADYRVLQQWADLLKRERDAAIEGSKPKLLERYGLFKTYWERLRKARRALEDEIRSLSQELGVALPEDGFATSKSILRS